VTGRPTDYAPELAEKICLLIAEGESLRQIGMLEDMPDKATIMRWCIKYPEFCEQYARAKEQQAEAFAEEIIDIADDARNDWIERENQRTGQTFIALNEEAIARSRVRIDARKWLMGKSKPKKYGDKMLNETRYTDKEGNDLNVTVSIGPKPTE
jgi:hypothetical protein